MATKPTVTVMYYDTSTSPYITLSSTIIQGVSWSSGRQNITDQWSGSTATIYGRNPSNITYKPVLGSKASVIVTNPISSTDKCQFFGYVSDFRIIYGTIPALDTWELTIESGYAKAGRTTGTVTTNNGDTTLAMALAISVLLGGSNFVNVGTGWGSTTSAQSIVGQLSNAVNQLMFTEQGTVVDTGSYVAGTSFNTLLGLYGRNDTSLGTTVAVFADGALAYIPFTQLEFLSAAQNYGQKVTVQASGFADQSAGSGDYNQTYSTINGSASEAANLAGYIKTELDFTQTVPYSITFTGAATKTLAAIFLADPQYIHQAVNITFRSTTYYAIIEGLSFSANASDWTCTLYLSSSLQNAFLRLDNAVYGTLDNNKLGF